jgi:hypothetical protein
VTFPSLTPSRSTLTRAAATAESLFLSVLPHGGQGTARRNAWRAMSSDVAEARARREAQLAVERAAARAAAKAAHPAAR